MLKSLLVYLSAATLFAAAPSCVLWDLFFDAPEPESAGPRTIDLYFYDLNTGQLFVAESDQIPPIDAPSGPIISDDGQARPAGVRAHVFACGSCPPDLAGKTAEEVEAAGAYIAYLEMYTEKVKAVLTGEQPLDAPMMIDPMEQTLVKRPADEEWVTMYSEAGYRLTESAIRPCPDGSPPVACRP